MRTSRSKWNATYGEPTAFPWPFLAGKRRFRSGRSWRPPGFADSGRASPSLRQQNRLPNLETLSHFLGLTSLTNEHKSAKRIASIPYVAILISIILLQNKYGTLTKKGIAILPATLLVGTLAKFFYEKQPISLQTKSRKNFELGKNLDMENCLK